VHYVLLIMEAEVLNILHKLTTYIKRRNRWRFRDRRAHYPSDALSCRRDQYWAWTGEPRTNPADYLGTQRMFIGTALEDALVKEYFSNIGIINVHLLGTQVPVGSSNPPWNGYLDILVGELEDDALKKYVIEIKTKTGYGANLMARTMEPQDSHLCQIGLYLKDLCLKGVTNEGILFYYLLSDANIGTMVAIHCRYNTEKDQVEAYFAENTLGHAKQLQSTQSIAKIEEKWKQLETAVAQKKCPKADFVYKYALTNELLEGLSDAQFRAALKGEKVLGDWQVKYSPYKDKQLEVDGIEPGYTAAEISTLRRAYRKRHPASKL